VKKTEPAHIFGGAKYFDFEARNSVWFDKYLSKHKMKRYARNFQGGHARV